MNEHKEVIVLSAEQTARDNRKYEVSSRTLARVERLMKEILHRLGLPDGSPINPDDVLGALQSAREGRTVLPSHYEGGITLYPYRVVPVPTYIWVKVAWQHVDLLGVKWQTGLALSDMRIFYVGTLLLHTEEELKRYCNARAVKDVKSCLARHGLQLPTAEELAAAKAAGFWVELPDQVRLKPSWNLRVATEFAPLEPTLELFQLRGSRDGFFYWAEITTLGDLLSKTEAEVRALWNDYVLQAHVGGNLEKVPEISQPMMGYLLTEIRDLADATVNWVAAAGLKFAEE